MDECKQKDARSEQENVRLQNLVDELMNNNAFFKEEIQRLKDEISILKGEKPRPVIHKNTLEPPGGEGKKNPKDGKIGRGKHPRKSKKTSLIIHQEQIIQPTVPIPDEAEFKGYKEYDVQDIVFTIQNTRYKLARYRLADGTYISGEVPKGIQGHYGPTLISYVLNDYYSCRVTEILLRNKLLECGIQISEGKLNDMLISNKKAFHKEKADLLSAGINAQNQILTDECHARHMGQNQYTNVIGNDFFSVFNTTDSKSRVNFLKLLQGRKHRYLINEDAIAYLENLNPLSRFGYLLLSKGDKFTTPEGWQEFLTSQHITQATEVRLVTEAALYASLIETGIPQDLGVHADDAGQFDAFVRSLCWIHENRHYRKIIPTSEQARTDLAMIRGKIWTIYRDLKLYKKNPNDTDKQTIEKQFDDLFLHTETSSPTLNKRLRMTYEKKQDLLRVLVRPDTPLHNNSSESAARTSVIKRKVSGGTRSDEGRDSRDTFLSLKQTRLKLGINFITFLKDRVCGLYEIPMLAEVIRQRSSHPTKAP